MKKNETKLLASRAVNKIGNVMYDYGNSTWIAGCLLYTSDAADEL